MFTSPSEVAFNLGAVSIRYYGICLALAMAVGLIISYKICKRYYKDINADIIFDISIPIIIFGIIGARLYYCILSWGYYNHHLPEIIQIYKGGLSIHGGIIGGVIGGVIYAKREKLPILKLCDIFSFGLVCGQIVGRWGNFFNSEAFGKPCYHFLKLYIPLEKRPLGYEDYEFFHPTFLYESILNFFVLLILFYILKKNPKSGKVFFAYLILYSTVRIAVESLRIDSVINIGLLPFPIIASIFIIFISTLCLRKI